MKKSILVRLAAIPSVVAASAGSALAAVPVDVSTELTTMKADALTVAGLVLVALIAVMAFKFMRKGF